MATKTKSTDAIGKVKFRVIEFELEGTDAAMQETIRGFTAALNRGNSVPVARHLRNRNSDPKQIGQTLEDTDQDVDAEVVLETDAEEPDTPRPRGDQAAQRRFVL
jgi:hypothetical protein